LANRNYKFEKRQKDLAKKKKKEEKKQRKLMRNQPEPDENGDVSVEEESPAAE